MFLFNKINLLTRRIKNHYKKHNVIDGVVIQKHKKLMNFITESKFLYDDDVHDDYICT